MSRQLRKLLFSSRGNILVRLNDWLLRNLNPPRVKSARKDRLAQQIRLLECADLTTTPAGLPGWGPRCQRFVRSRSVAATLRLSLLTHYGARPPKTNAVTGHRTPRS